jgi:hypothetical protein
MNWKGSGRDRDLIEELSRHLSEEDEENHENSQ